MWRIKSALVLLLVLCSTPSFADGVNTPAAAETGGLPSTGSEGDCLLSSSGQWAAGACPGAGTGAPTTASYWTKVAEATLSNEIALGSLATGLIINTTTTGVPTIYAGATCTNQVIRVLSVSGAATCSTITSAFVDSTVWTGTASSGLLKASSQGVLTTATAGTDYTSPSSTESPTNKTIDCNGTGNSCSNIDLTADVIGILPGANGGTANGFMAFSGPTTTLKTFTLPNASASILTTNTKVTLAQGGTNQDAWTPSDCVRVNAAGTALESAGAACGSGGGGAPTDYAYWGSGTNATLSAEINLAALGTGLVINTAGTPSIYAGATCTNQFIRILGASAAATCASVSLTADVTGTLGVTNGGSGIATVAADQVYVGTAADTLTAKTLPDCDNATTSKLLYDQATHAFSCGTDQSAGGGTTFDALGSGSNTTATMTVGSGGSLAPTGTGVLVATAARPNVTTVNAGNSPYTALTTDFLILCDTTAASRAITLPAATNKLLLRIKNLGANTCTITRAGTDTIDGATSAVLTTQYEAIDVVTDASAAWSVF